MSDLARGNWLDRPVDDKSDHILGPADAPITLVEYGSYACPYCRAANERIAEVRDQFGDRLRYVFRHRPLVGVELARRAAELVERAERSETLLGRARQADDPVGGFDRGRSFSPSRATSAWRPKAVRPTMRRSPAPEARVDADEASARASGALITPTFFINGRRYDGPWDESAFADAMLGTLGHRVRSAALDFASWGPSTGVLLLLATLFAVISANTAAGADPHRVLGAGFRVHVRRPQLFDVVAALDQRRTADAFLSGGGSRDQAGVHRRPPDRLALRRAAGRRRPRRHGRAGIALSSGRRPRAVVARLGGADVDRHRLRRRADRHVGSRVPVELRIFLTAAAIVDDIGAIVAVAAFYSGELHLIYLAAAVPLVGALAMLNRSQFTRSFPIVAAGALWASVLASGLHPTLAGVVLALFIPTRPPANLIALTTQANAIVTAEAERGGEVLRHGPSVPALRALDAIHDRLESPADRLLRHAGARSSYLVLPLFALANAGVTMTPGTFGGRERLLAAIIVGLTIGKPLGIMLVLGACRLAEGRGQAARIFMGPTGRRRRARRHRVHDVPLHRRPGVPRRGRLRSREDRGLCRLGALRRDRRYGALDCGAGAGGVRRLSARAMKLPLGRDQVPGDDSRRPH